MDSTTMLESRPAPTETIYAACMQTLSFAVQSAEQLHDILEFGERVDGSSLFSYIDADKSDIYIMPRTESSFINPFSPAPTLNILHACMRVVALSLEMLNYLPISPNSS